MTGFKPQIERRDQAAWNIGMVWSNFVGSMVMSGIKNYRAGFLNEWFWDFQALRELINADLTPGEKVLLNSYEEKIFPLLKGQRITDRVKFTETTREYQRKILRLLKEQGYIPNKEDRTRLSF